VYRQEQGSEQWTAAFSEKLSGNLQAWNALSPEERLGFCTSVAPGKGKCRSGARSRSRTGSGAAASKTRRSKKGWTCYTRFFVERLQKDGIVLSRVSTVIESTA